MRFTFLLVLALLVICVLEPADCAEWYVDGSVSTSGDGTSWDTAFQKIQEGIEAASDSDTMTVAKGTYVENIQFNGKNIILTSTDPLDPSVVANTIIDGNKLGSVVTFSGTESEACDLSGFTIQNGEGDYGGGICGGTDPDRNHATIQNNTITSNSAVRGGGLYYCDGTIQNNTISGNSALHDGGGVYYCNGTIQDNRITGNSGGQSGGGLGYCDGTIQNNTITGNSVSYGGGGLNNCNGTIQNNTITGNSASQGGGLAWCNGTIQNNTISGNSGGRYGGGVCSCNGTIQNCIIWGNTGPTGSQLHESSIPTYSCIQDWSGGGEGNTGSEPRFLDLNAGDYRLQEGSPCIDAGFNDPELPETDLAGMHRIMFGGKSLTVDMGAYEFHIWPPTVDSQTGGLTLKWSILFDKTYSICYSSDMLTWELLQGDLYSLGDTFTTWTDPTPGFSTGDIRRRYYRIVENE